MKIYLPEEILGQINKHGENAYPKVPV